MKPIEKAQWIWLFVGVAGIIILAIGGAEGVLQEKPEVFWPSVLSGGLMVAASFLWTFLRVFRGK